MSEIEMNETARRGFESQAVAYRRGRPSYPDSAIRWMTAGLPPRARILDLAAGTGKLTRELVARGFDVLAVEPVQAMSEQLRMTVRGVEVVVGSAEDTGLPDASVDAVTVGQAFHWFNHREALMEIARVLKPGGRLALAWNDRDDSVPWVGKLSALLHSDLRMPYERHLDWQTIVGKAPGYRRVERADFSFEHTLHREGLLNLVSSVSYIAAMPAAERQSYLDRAERIVADLDEPYVLPYICHTYRVDRR